MDIGGDDPRFVEILVSPDEIFEGSYPVPGVVVEVDRRTSIDTEIPAAIANEIVALAESSETR